jgi:hypothetical protein
MDGASSTSAASSPSTTRQIATTAVNTSIVATTQVGAASTSVSSVPSGFVPALELLGEVVVENEHSGGYQRSLFPHWADLDGDGCNTRAEVLMDESSSNAQVDPYGCHVVEGDWLSLYDGREITDPADLQIDHVVALKEAWDSGAWEWSATARKLYANDLTDDRTLRAVSSSTNQSKSDKDPSNWLPPSPDALCTYLGDWVSIKVRWNLSMDQSEYGRIRNLLTDDCADLVLRVPDLPPVSVPAAGGSGNETVDTTDTGAGSGGSSDVYYQNCSEARAAGAAPLRRGDPGYRSGLDRDHDGVACEG